MPNEPFALTNSRIKLEKLIRRDLLALHAKADEIERSRAQEAAIATRQNVLQAGHPEFVDPDYREVAAHWIWILGLAVLYVFDFLLLSAPAEYLTLKNFPNHQEIAFLSRFFVPFAVLFIELFLAVKLRHARASHVESGAFMPVLAWFGFALCWGSCIAAWVYFAQRATDILSALLPALIAFKCLVAIIAFLIHCLVGLSGEPLSEAKAYLAFRIRWRRLQRAMKLQVRAEYQNCKIATTIFARYVDAISERNRDFPGQRPILLGPFSYNVRKFILATFSEVVSYKRDDMNTEPDLGISVLAPKMSSESP